MKSTNNNKIATCTSTNKDVSKQLSQQIGNLSVKNDVLTICANCGKQGNDLNACNKCDLVAYCNAACKKKHQSKHKNECEKRAAELHDDELFNQPPPDEDCPICMLLLPSLDTGYIYSECCGKIICSGCIHAVAIRDGGVGLCPFCRTPTPETGEALIDQVKKRVEIGDAQAIYNMGCHYNNGRHVPQDHTKALELWHQAAKLGNAKSYYSIGNSYYRGNGVERDEKKAWHYYELAAMGGHATARYNLGALEVQAGNMDRVIKHHMIAAGCGYTVSLDLIKQMFMNGDATKDDYAKALRAYQANLVEIKSPQRDEAATFADVYKYY